MFGRMVTIAALLTLESLAGAVWCAEPASIHARPIAVPVSVDARRVTCADGIVSASGCDPRKAFDGAWANASVAGAQWIVEKATGDAWVKVDFRRPTEVFEIDLQDSRVSGGAHVKDVRFEFSTGGSVDAAMTDSGARQTFPFAPVKTEWLKVHVLSRYDGPAGDAPFGFAEVGVYTPIPPPAPGVHDLSGDGVADTLVFRWMNHLTVFVADGGRLPWKTDLGRDWDAYFRAAFRVGSNPQETWNPERGNWGSYTLLVDKNDDGRFDDVRDGDFTYQVVDIDGDGDSDIERTDRYHGEPLDIMIDKFFYDLDDDNRMNYIDWSGWWYGDEQAYTGDAKYLQDTAGNGFFSLVFEHWRDSIYPDLRPAWENPIAFYDTNDDGVTDYVVRETDSHGGANGRLRESELCFDIDASATPEHPQSFDLQLSWIGQQSQPFDYSRYVEDFPQFRGRPWADFLFGRRTRERLQTKRMWIPYFDAYKIGTELEGLKWNNVFLLVDEDDDDIRWEEMFSPHEFVGPGTPLDKHVGYDDHIGDRWECDDDYQGKGKLYVGKFDGRIHLYHADRAEWTIDYRKLYKGSLDRPQETPAPPDGLLYSVVQYLDTDHNGFIDRIVYGERRVGDVNSLKVVREVNLLALATPSNPHPDVCDLFDIKTADKLSGRKVSGWDGRRVTGLRNEACERMRGLFAETASERWRGAIALYLAARKAGVVSGLAGSPMPSDAMTVSREDYAATLKLKDIRVTPVYWDVLTPRTEWERYTDAYFLGEAVFAQLMERAPAERRTDLQRLYYTGRLDELAKVVANADWWR